MAVIQTTCRQQRSQRLISYYRRFKNVWKIQLALSWFCPFSSMEKLFIGHLGGKCCYVSWIFKYVCLQIPVGDSFDKEKTWSAYTLPVCVRLLISCSAIYLFTKQVQSLPDVRWCFHKNVQKVLRCIQP